LDQSSLDIGEQDCHVALLLAMTSQVHNLIIIGSGPAGLTAGIYTGRAALEPLLFSGITIGGQLMYTTEVENFPGYPQGIMGPQLMLSMREQAEKFGTKVRLLQKR